MDTYYKKKIVSNLRGFYISSIIFSLSNDDILENLLNNKGLSKRNKILKKNKKIKNLIDYLLDINYMHEKKNFYKFTELGYDIFTRYYTFLVPCSYHNYLLNLDKFFSNKFKPKVDRKKNILGSGITHKRYFYNAISYLRLKNEKINVVDLGCGNGFFLQTADSSLNIDKIVGIDLSKISVNDTKKLFIRRKKTKFFTSDVGNLNAWSKKLDSFINKKEKNIYFFMWFIIHEISEKSKIKIIKFLKKLKKHYPNSKFVICELLKNNFKDSKTNVEYSLMPEYQFFHNFSDQGILSLKDYNEIFKKTKLKLEKKVLFDNINIKAKNLPSAAIFFLK